jgi:hypothetical protein
LFLAVHGCLHAHSQDFHVSFVIVASQAARTIAMTEPDKPAERGIFSSVANETALFGEGIFHGSIENLYNGPVQIVNHISGAHLPELHLVDSDIVSHSAAGRVGMFIGKAADFIALTILSGGLGAKSKLYSAARMAAVSGVYSGIIEPSDPDSKTFFADRGRKSGIAALSAGTMGVAGAGLDGLGIFSAPEARSFLGSLGYGSLAGAAVGAVHAETNAILNQNRLIPHATDFLRDVTAGTAIGIFAGGCGCGSIALKRLAVKQIPTGDSDLRVLTKT